MKGSMMILILLLITLVLSLSGICGAFTPKDHYLLSCGPLSNSAGDVSTLTWDSRASWSHDENATFTPISSFSSTVAVSVVSKGPSAPMGIPFMGARIFRSNFTYSFPVSPGPKFLRLYFYPAVYSEFDASQFFISVQANGHLLLRNFSAQLAVNYSPFTVSHNTTTDRYVIKEYYVPVPIGETSLDLTFFPTTPTSYAFVNGIELVSVPEGLYITDDMTVNFVGSQTQFQISNTSALETVYRLNVGSSDFPVIDDGNETGMYRTWKDDTPYALSSYSKVGLTKNPIRYTEKVPNYTAPEGVYQSFVELGQGNERNEKLNLTWRFKVDPGFYYMVRFHWCELDSHITATGDRVFQVFINSIMADSYIDVFFLTGNQKYVPYYKDYVVSVPQGDGGGGGSDDIWIALHPNTHLSTYYDVLLNGLEIFKINKYNDGSLDAPNPQVPLDKTPSLQDPIIEPPKRTQLLHAAIGGIGVGAFLITSLACLLIFRSLKAKKQSSKHVTSTSKSTNFQPGSNTATSSERGSTLPSHLCRRFSIAEIRLATHNFSEGLIIGHGGFGNVYKGMVEGEKGPLAVAIKRLNASSKQGVREFMTEIEMLSKLRHVHLVSLIGFCDDNGEMVLVYEYMDRGTLRDHLYNTDNPPMSWNRRLNACIGAAKGLHYLHSGASHMIIHRDIKSTNILLDENWVSKVSDLGLSKLGPLGDDLTHVSTVVKGSIGYLDLEYYKSQQLTEKSDVYSFGVVLFEVLCGRAAVDPSLSKEQVNLAKWARTHQRKGTLDVVVDPKIKDEIASPCLRKFGEIAESCVRDHGRDRPSMADVVWSLQFVLDLQQRDDDTMSNCNNSILPSTSPNTVEVAITANTTTAATTPTNDSFNFSTTSGERITRTNSSSALILSVSEDYGDNTSVTFFSEILMPLGR